MGVGIWSMHYIGMLAFSLPVPVLYDWPTVLLSLIAAVFASAVALFVVSRKTMGWPQALVGSAMMGGGIATMHYTGMAAMRLEATISYQTTSVVASVVIAIVAATAALWIAFHARSSLQRGLSSLVMGGAVSGMHYTAIVRTASFLSTILCGSRV
jgi:NO-binding membrane sensor protein with MHYT domain